MKVKHAVKHFTLLSMMSVGISACSSIEVIEEQPTPPPAVVVPVAEEPEVEVINTVMKNGVIDIPILSNANVFAEFTHALPAVINYFTSSTEVQIINFYQQAFGKANFQERKRGRLTLKYQQGDELMRVVISQQNKKRQVDIIIEEK